MHSPRTISRPGRRYLYSPVQVIGKLVGIGGGCNQQKQYGSTWTKSRFQATFTKGEQGTPQDPCGCMRIQGAPQDPCGCMRVQGAPRDPCGCMRIQGAPQDPCGCMRVQGAPRDPCGCIRVQGASQDPCGCMRVLLQGAPRAHAAV